MRTLLIDAMTPAPLTSTNPVYPSPPYEPGFADSWCLEGIKRLVADGRVRETEKSGLAYSFVIENAYCTDENTGRSFFLTVTVYHHPNATLNDNTYGYDFSRQFLVDLGEAVASQLWLPPSESD